MGVHAKRTSAELGARCREERETARRTPCTSATQRNSRSWGAQMMTRRRFALCAVAAASTAATFCAVDAAGVGTAASVTRSQVSHDRAVLAGEPYVMPDPLHPGVITVVWLGTSDFFGHTTTAAPVSYCSIATTFDDGVHWTKPQPLPIVRAAAQGRTVTAQVNGRPDVICGDPVGGVGPDGTVYAGAAAVGSPSWEQGFSSLRTHGLSWDYGPTEMF